jgi:hypothetical protein
VPQNPTAKVKKKLESATHRRIKVLLPAGILTAPQKIGLPNLSQSWKMPHCLFNRILWIWLTCRALKSLDTSKKGQSASE